VRAAIVNGGHLDVLDVWAAIRVLVLDPKIRSLNAPVAHRQAVILGPALDLVAASRGSPIRVGSTAIPILKEPLVLALQFIVEHHAIDSRPGRFEALRDTLIGAIELSVVGQLSGLHGTCVIGLTSPAARTPVLFKELSAALGKRDQDGPLASIQWSDRLDESLGTKVLQVAAAQSSRSALVITKIIRRHHAEGADRSERTCFGAA
jgi:hypothetical protein